MGLFDYFFKKSYLDGETYNFRSEILGSKNATYIDLSNLEQVYKEVPHLRLVIDTRSQMLSSGIWKYFNKKGESIENEITYFLNKPNFLQSGKEFLNIISVQECIYGNAFVYKNKVGKQLGALMPLRSDNIKVNLTGKLYKQVDISGVIENYEVLDTKEFLEVDEVLRFKINDNNLIISDSLIKSLKQPLSNLKAVYDSRNVLLKERGAIGVLTVNDTTVDKQGNFSSLTDPETKRKAEEKLVNDYGIGKGQRRVNITKVPITWTPMVFPTKDLMLFEEEIADFELVINAYGLNKNLFINSSYDNVAEAQKNVYQNTIIPTAERYAQILGSAFDLPKGDVLYLDYSHLPFMQEDEKYKAEIMQIRANTISTMIANGMQLNEETQSQILRGDYED